MVPNHQLAKTVGPLFAFPELYPRLIGKLIYFTLTFLELAYTLHTLAQFMQVSLATLLGCYSPSGPLS